VLIAERLIVVCIFLSGGNGTRLVLRTVILFDNGGEGCSTFRVLEVKGSGWCSHVSCIEVLCGVMGP
jgi:hypothetical protein